MEDLFELASRQHGVVSRSQVLEAVGTKRRLGHLVAAGLLSQGPGSVLRVAGSPETWRQRVMAGVLSVPGSLASHRTGAALRRLEGSAPGPVELVVTRWHRCHRGRGLIVHESKDLAAVDVDECDGIPTTSLVRTLVDLPAVAPAFRCGQALDHAHRDQPGILSQVRARHLEVARKGRNGTRLLRALLAERGEGLQRVDSGFERLALRLVTNAGLPTPVPQHQVRDGDEVCYLDLAWPDRLVAMECDSLAHHMGEAAFRWERARRRLLNRHGWTVLEFTYHEVTRQGPMVVAELRRHLS